MPHTHKKKQKKVPKKYTPILPSHCNVKEVASAIFYQIKSNWITEDEFEQVIKIVHKRLKDENK